MARITRERAERIAKAYPCEICGEYSYKKVAVRAATKSEQESLGLAWHARKICGVCGTEQELGLDREGNVVFVT